MAKYLVIVESPTKEKTLKKILGKDYTIKSSKGHLIDLPKTKLGIDIENNFKPEYVVIPKQRKALKELQESIKGKEKVFLATDPDREGEAIAWHIAQKLNIKDAKSRVSFNEITEKAVSQSIKNPREINLNMVNSQKARRLLDRLVGYKISPLLWKKIGKKLSAGRVQSVTLRLICEREEEKSETKKYIEKHYGKDFAELSQNLKIGKNKIKNVKIQDAHESIRPTYVFNLPESIRKYLTNDQYKLYNLIWQRFVASRMKAAYLEKITIDIKSGRYIFRTSGSKTLFKGYMVLYDQNNKDLDKIPNLKEKDKLKLLKIKENQSFTKPSPRYTEASLVKRLEKEGIGRPSTYVPTISTLQYRTYVEKVDKKFRPTELGITVNSFLVQYFSDIVNVAFTAKMEKQLDEVESDKKKWENVLDKFYKAFSKDLEKGSQAQKIEMPKIFSDEICDKCGSKMLIKNGRFGKFLACSGFPKCKNTKPFLDKIGISCPEEGCSGEIIRKKTKKGRVFYGCSLYPKCTFVTWNKPINKRCPQCNSILVISNNKKNGLYFKCSNSDCDYKEFKKEDKS